MAVKETENAVIPEYFYSGIFYVMGKELSYRIRIANHTVSVILFWRIFLSEKERERNYELIFTGSSG